MKALKLNVVIGQDRRVVVDIPDDIEEGPAEVLVLVPESSVRRRTNNLDTHIARLRERPRGRSAAEIDADMRAERESWD